MVVLPQLEAANRLARWLMRKDDDAEDVVQEVSLRALRYFHTFTEGNARALVVRDATLLQVRTSSASCSRRGLDEMPGCVSSLSSATRSASRARESLDITVPTGIPMTSANSR